MAMKEEIKESGGKKAHAELKAFQVSWREFFRTRGGLWVYFFFCSSGEGQKLKFKGITYVKHSQCEMPAIVSHS